MVGTSNGNLKIGLGYRNPLCKQRAKIIEFTLKNFNNIIYVGKVL